MNNCATTLLPPIMDSFSDSEEIAEVRTVFQAGLVPYHSKCVFDSNRAMLLPSNMEGKSPANLFGFLLPYGYCPVVCDTLLSDNIASGLDKLDLPGVRMAIIEQATLNWAESTHIMDIFSTSDGFAEVGTLFEAGLVPWSMAGDLGEEERKSACKHGILYVSIYIYIYATLLHISSRARLTFACRYPNISRSSARQTLRRER